MIFGGFFFFVKSMKKIIHPVPASWMESSSVQILLNLKCLQPCVQKINRFKTAADVPRTPRPGLPIENTSKLLLLLIIITLDYNMSYLPVSPAYAAATFTSSPELFISFAIGLHTTRMDHHILELHWLISAHLFCNCKKLHIN